MIVKERASERSGEPIEGLAKETRMGASSQAASAARRGHWSAGGAPGVAKATPVGLLARDFQHFMKISRQPTQYIIEQHMNMHRRS